MRGALGVPISLHYAYPTAQQSGRTLGDAKYRRRVWPMRPHQTALPIGAPTPFCDASVRARAQYAPYSPSNLDRDDRRLVGAVI